MLIIVKPEKRIPLATPTTHGEEMEFVKQAFDRNWIAPLGFNCDGLEGEIAEFLAGGSLPAVEAFDDFSETSYIANRRCVSGDNTFTLYTLALGSGTSALHLALKLAGVKRGDVVLCSDMTFSATVNPVSYEGAVQVFVDSEYETWNMDPAALEVAFNKYPQAKVVLLAHLYGTPSKIDEIRAVCEKHNAILIEDAAESLGATYHGIQTGTFGDYSAISFNGNKIITSSGGGMLITHSKETRDKAFFWATQAREAAPWYQHEEIGYNYRMSNVSAGVGRGQLRHLEEHRSKKEAIYHRYEAGFKGLPLKMNPYLMDTHPNFWLSCLILDENAPITAMDLYKALADAQIETRPIWKPMHMQPVFKDRDYIKAGEKSVSEDVFARGLCLPSDIKMTEEEQDYVIEQIRNLVSL